MSGSGVADYSGDQATRPGPSGPSAEGRAESTRPEEGRAGFYALAPTPGGPRRPPKAPPAPDPFDGAEAGGSVGRPCDYWVYYEEWQTMEDERVCPECGPLDGRWFRQGAGPYPPLHDNCRCVRRLVWWECICSSAGGSGVNY